MQRNSLIRVNWRSDIWTNVSKFKRVHWMGSWPSLGNYSPRKDVTPAYPWMNTALLSREIREIWDPPKTAPMLVKSKYICEVAWYTRGCCSWQIHPPPFTQLARHSNCIIRNSFSKCMSIVPICSAQQGHLSYDVALHHAQTLLGWEGLCMNISHLWEEAKIPPRTAQSPLTIRHPGTAQPSLIYPKFAGTQGAIAFLFIVLRNVFYWHACRSAVYIPKHVAHTGRWKF